MTMAKVQRPKTRQTNPQHMRDLIERVARINAADEWRDDLNPTQWAALSYLARANRFSRSPSQVAAFMSATRGTVSQTLKALARKELIAEIRSETDRRWISYAVGPKGRQVLDRSTVIDEAIETLGSSRIQSLIEGLEALVRGALKARDQRSFGLCKTCPHHKSKRAGAYCMLLHEELTREEAEQICFEHQEAA